MADEYTQAAETLEALGLDKVFQAIVETYNDGKRIKREAIDPLIKMHLVIYDGGRAYATHRGLTVSTRLTVRAARRKPAKPRHWSS